LKPKFTIVTAHSGRPIMPQWHIAMQRLIQPPNTVHFALHTLGLAMDDAYNQLAEQSLKLETEFTMFVDDDTQIPPNTLVDLMNVLENSSPDVMVAGGIYTSRQPPISPHVFMEYGGGPFWKWRFGDIFPCYALGSGCMMIRNEAFRQLERPWFKKVDTLDELKTYGDLFPTAGLHSGMVSVDIFFCQKLAKAGFKVMAHGGICPIHWGDDQRPYFLSPDSYPMKIGRAHRIDGWITGDELSWLAKQAETHRNIVEVGSHLGRSTRALGDYSFGTVWAFDDWKGPRDVAMSKNGEFRHAFENNLADLLESGKVKMVVGDHSDTWQINATPDMVFIDGSHEYEDVRRDIQNWRKRMPVDSLICGHDISRPSVLAAVEAEYRGLWKKVPNCDIWAVSV
jgi:predicted O-methyltransferase YrrM